MYCRLVGTFDQAEWEIRFEWGSQGVKALAPISQVVIVVDVLRFTTAVTAGIERDAVIYPYPWRDSSVEDFARSVRAHVAQSSSESLEGAYSLAPRSMASIPAGTRLVLPSPNGSALSFEAQRSGNIVLAGCLRNVKAVAEAAQSLGKSVAVIASGERWDRGHEVRPAVEDLLGAGAIISHMHGSKSPEALAAEAVFASFELNLEEFLRQTSSGKELIEAGHAEDVLFASALDASQAVPFLADKAFIRWQG